MYVAIGQRRVRLRTRIRQNFTTSHNFVTILKNGSKYIFFLAFDDENIYFFFKKRSILNRLN
jgi:hypothetical protein